MIFASDLDQTLIYSVRSMGLGEDSELIMPAERIRDKVSAYISVQALDKLKQFAERHSFIPVTTRTVEQYRRIHIFQEHVIPQFAITSNGGNILTHGVVDAEWNAFVAAKAAKESAPAAEVKAAFDRIANESWVLGERWCDELFYAIVIQRDKAPVEAIEELSAGLRRAGWEVSLQGRKLYLIPACVNKGDALAHVRKRLGTDAVIASGDSILDRCLLDGADYSIAPRHGELFREQQKRAGSSPYTFTARSGILAADEILDFVAGVIPA